MEKDCKNCEYFKQLGLYAGKHQWGKCVKPSTPGADVNSKEKDGVLKWGTETCSDFKGSIINGTSD
jgi:hypothetical protein